MKTRIIFTLMVMWAFNVTFGAPDGSSILTFYQAIGPSEILQTDDSSTVFKKTAQHYVAVPVTILASPFLGARDGFSDGLSNMGAAPTPFEKIGRGLLVLPEALVMAPAYLFKSGSKLSSLHKDSVAPVSGSTYGSANYQPAQVSVQPGQAKPTAGMALNTHPSRMSY